MLNILPFSTDTGPAETNEQKHRPGLLSGQRLVESQVAKSSSTSRFNNLRDRPGLDVNTVLKMLKGSLPTTIAVAMQAIVGYLTTLTTIVSQGLLPRAKFMKTMLFNLLATCVSTSMCCLTIFYAIKAREHILLPGGNIQDYNSSIYAVSTLWLISAIRFVFL
ncbi:hypothetical protein V2W45_186183 [Cenococcum geophilum]